MQNKFLQTLLLTTALAVSTAAHAVSVTAHELAHAGRSVGSHTPDQFTEHLPAVPSANKGLKLLNDKPELIGKSETPLQKLQPNSEWVWEGLV